MAKFNSFDEAIDFSFWKNICIEHGTLRHYKRGEYFVNAGNQLQYVGWIVSGGFKHSLIDNYGNNKAVGFVFDRSILANYLSIIFRKAMPTDIIALEDSDVMVLRANIIRNLLEKDHTLNLRFSQALFEQAYYSVLNHYQW